MNRTTISILTFAVIVALNSCHDSEPYVPVGPHFYVEHSIHDDGLTEQVIYANLFTGDLKQYGELKDGAMTLNGKPLKLGEDEHGLPRYFDESPAVTPNTKYTFEIRLANGLTASAEVTTQQSALTALTTPATADAQHDMTISWPAVSNHDQMVVSVYYTAKNSTDEMLAGSFKLTSDDIAAASYTIPKLTFSRSNIRSARIQLIGYKTGTATNFLDGGRIVSKMSVEKVVDVK